MSRPSSDYKSGSIPARFTIEGPAQRDDDELLSEDGDGEVQIEGATVPAHEATRPTASAAFHWLVPHRNDGYEVFPNTGLVYLAMALALVSLVATAYEGVIRVVRRGTHQPTLLPTNDCEHQWTNE